jgi:hypothetical protein
VASQGPHVKPLCRCPIWCDNICLRLRFWRFVYVYVFDKT